MYVRYVFVYGARYATLHLCLFCCRCSTRPIGIGSQLGRRPHPRRDRCLFRLSRRCSSECRPTRLAPSGQLDKTTTTSFFFLNLDPLMLMQWALHWFIKSTVLSCFHSSHPRRCRRFCRYCAQKLVLPVNATTTSSSLLIPKGQQRSTINQRLHIQYDTVRPVAATADSNSSSGLVLSNFCCIAAVVFDNNFDLD